ncbi:hypothetical protein N8314_00835 [Akkermansiaceae bacterium]|nr:hypothetical protein [Akkermansiaceae bacterium]
MNLHILYLDENTDTEVELEVVIEHYQPEVKGRFYGAPEDCYPDEPAELEYAVLDKKYRHLEYDSWFYDIVLSLVEEVRSDD